MKFLQEDLVFSTHSEEVRWFFSCYCFSCNLLFSDLSMLVLIKDSIKLGERNLIKKKIGERIPSYYLPEYYYCYICILQ